jgi:hypothetical protein
VKNNRTVNACFDCYADALEPFPFDGEMIRYNAPERDIDLNDWVVFYDKDGSVFTRIKVKTLTEGKLSVLKKAVAEDAGIQPDDIAIIIEAVDEEPEE